MEIYGDFDGFYSFLLQLERLPRITRVPKMTLKRTNGERKQQGRMKAEVTLSIFFEGGSDDSDDTTISRGGRL
jgi:type IV pilus assembly protein PilO